MATWPALIFYSSGNRLEVGTDKTNIIGVGGIYLGGDMSLATVNLNGEVVGNRRFFDLALYLQDLNEGVHRVEVEKTDLQTWVKEITIYSYWVTEATVFNLPTRPQVRLITEYQTATGSGVVFGATVPDLTFATVVNKDKLLAITGNTITTYKENLEYKNVLNLLTTTMGSASAGIAPSATGVAFGAETELSTTTKVLNNTRLFERGPVVYIAWDGDDDKMPFYHCTTYQNGSTTVVIAGSRLIDDRLCHREIQVSQGAREALFFDFFPGRYDLILLQYKDGLYVSEIDERGGRNIQLLYPGERLRVGLGDGLIYVKDDDLLVEVLTTIP